MRRDICATSLKAGPFSAGVDLLRQLRAGPCLRPATHSSPFLSGVLMRRATVVLGSFLLIFLACGPDGGRPDAGANNSNIIIYGGGGGGGAGGAGGGGGSVAKIDAGQDW